MEEQQGKEQTRKELSAATERVIVLARISSGLSIRYQKKFGYSSRNSNTSNVCFVYIVISIRGTAQW